MAKSQKRNNREAKKPKKTVKTIVAPVSVFDTGQAAPKKKGHPVTA
jgi:hypothetical protein